MKKLLTSIKKLFIWLFKQIKNTAGLIKSLWHFIGKPYKARVFTGYWHWSLAKKYAHKRYEWYPVKLDQLGKSQGIFAYGDESLIVISPKEIKLLKKRKYINNPKWYRKIFKNENLYKVD